ncbi:uncharacterized protein ATNIH1004_011755 [Aspergillus tanneri]|uniref:Uncharacterized protein n=1 Tax=Aspergillus tanneri TaxID=1220188 RepID=A0A5M9MAQ5_9EURO|nr:uncharacterized protein ATNIH1004_011755 [Aspergillus tanneri]KAA8641619.1 hypothetical protein ATNIH1004_011755 [Aspergillus tanneri]
MGVWLNTAEVAEWIIHNGLQGDSDILEALNHTKLKGNDASDAKNMAIRHGHVRNRQGAGTARAATYSGTALQRSEVNAWGAMENIRLETTDAKPPLTETCNIKTKPTHATVEHYKSLGHARRHWSMIQIPKALKFFLYTNHQSQHSKCM